MKMTKPPLFSTTTNILPCLALLLISLPLLVISQLPPSEIEILLNIKKHWNNQHLTNSWNSTTSPCRWPGIKCNSGETITRISLEGFNITGSLPPAICDLKNLTFLALRSNSIQGEFPTFLYNCSNLQTLDLTFNLLVGHLPNDISSLSPRLRYLYLTSNKFTGDIPSSIGQLKGLIELHFENNQFNGTFPSELGNLVHLDTLDLSHNPFSNMRLPTEFGMLRSLKGLSMCHCNLIGEIPENFANLSSLEFIYLEENRLVGEIPSGLFLLKNLTYLDLHHNKLSRELPSSMEALELREIDLSNNNLSGLIPTSLGSLPNLQYLKLSNNRFSGQIPPRLACLTFDSLDLSGNNLSGKIPFAFHDCRYETSFRSNPNLSWNIPTFHFRKCSSKSFSFRFLATILLPGAAIILVILYLIYFKVIAPRRRKGTAAEQPEWTMTPFHKLNFTVANIVPGLTEDNVIGSGGAGKIYCVDMDDSCGKVAVKKIWNRKSNDALEKQFIAEAEILGRIRHTNIVKLWCCVSREDSKLLVYEYMENSSLNKWLHRNIVTRESELSRSDSNQYHVVLDWPTRLRIAIGAAKGLSYMHHDCSPPIIHRDVKSSNILLDSDFNGKIADFGLAKMSANNVGDPHTVSAVAGSLGYIAPEYWQTRKLNEKIDIFSFGVVLLELATGKHPCKGNEHMNLAEWSWHHYCEDHPIADALDNEIKEPYFLEEMKKVFQLGLMCTNAVPTSRPPMKRVLQMLTACSSREEAPNRRAQTRDEEDNGITPFMSNI